MSECATSGERNRRPLGERAGEVTKKKKAATSSSEENNEEDPPAFNGPRIGGAKNLYGKDVTVSQHGKTQNGRDIFDIGGIRINDMGLQNRHAKLQRGTYSSAPAGKARIWACVSDVQRTAWSDTSIWVSQSCKSCLDGETPCSGWEPEVWPVMPNPAPIGRVSATPTMLFNEFTSSEPFPANWHITSKGRVPPIRAGELFLPVVPDIPNSRLRCKQCCSRGTPCLRMVEYEVSQDKVPGRRTLGLEDPRSYFERWFDRTKDTSLGIPTQSSEADENLAREPGKLAQGGHTVPINASGRERRAARPTYSRVRDAYERLVEERYDRQCRSRTCEIPKEESPDFWTPATSYYSWNTQIAFHQPRTVPSVPVSEPRIPRLSPADEPRQYARRSVFDWRGETSAHVYGRRRMTKEETTEEYSKGANNSEESLSCQGGDTPTSEHGISEGGFGSQVCGGEV